MPRTDTHLHSEPGITNTVLPALPIPLQMARPHLGTPTFKHQLQHLTTCLQLPQVLGGNALLIRAMLEAVGVFARVLGPPFASRGVIMRKVLLVLLERLADPCPSVASSAAAALGAVCLHCGYPSRRALLAANADYLVDGLCCQLRSLDSHPRSAPVLGPPFIHACNCWETPTTHPSRGSSLEVSVSFMHAYTHFLPRSYKHPPFTQEPAPTCPHHSCTHALTGSCFHAKHPPIRPGAAPRRCPTCSPMHSLAPSCPQAPMHSLSNSLEVKIHAMVALRSLAPCARGHAVQNHLLQHDACADICSTALMLLSDAQPT